ncbi:lipoprotein-releasing ABC transporter permease subunit [Shewanella maritima]|uniref:Lipoprotein-releasing ABC transporter permease subunit n=1 Tax=Shewanella maritima TaxID=2520507 RepID=A0A411PLG1_9GAMM|nr:lipoprotein-releasing ABC transporter permease subunit [Shewanella maritima]QBF84380.1 lipoprotein-releasing ABC transporter permease subunit [Shewanella maritima]
MNLGFSFYIGFRYWRARKANAFASFITFFAVSGIFLGVAALIIVSSVMNGLEAQLKDRILGAVPQLTLVSEQGFADWQDTTQRVLKQHHDIKGMVPSATTQAMVQSVNNIHAVQVLGIYPEHEQGLSQVMSHSFDGAFAALTPGSYQIVLGRQLAMTLGVSVGERIRVLSGDGVVYSPLGPVPSQRKFTVAGIFEMGSQVDANLAYVHYQDLRRLMRKNPDQVNELRAYLSDPFDAPVLAQQITAQFQTHANLEQNGGKEQGADSITVVDWRQQFGHLFSAVKMEKNMMSLMLSLIIAVAAFNIVSALVMMVVDKTTDVAVLKTQGLTTQSVMAIFIVQGGLNAVLGLLSGTLAGIVVTLNINSILNAIGISVLGAGQTLPASISVTQIGVIVVGTLFVTLAATLYPAYTAAKVQPATALRYE